MRKYRMGEAILEGKRLTCSLGVEWPPVEVSAYGSVEEAIEHLEDSEVQRLRVWEKVCGLLRVDPEKCKSCPHKLLDGKSGKKEMKPRELLSGAASPRFHSPYRGAKR